MGSNRPHLRKFGGRVSHIQDERSQCLQQKYDGGLSQKSPSQVCESREQQEFSQD
jgi:hypothetical protein